MTTFRPFHRWIQPTSTADTVMLAFGGWWDADAAGGLTATIAAFAPEATAALTATAGRNAQISASAPAATSSVSATAGRAADIAAAALAATSSINVTAGRNATIAGAAAQATAAIAATAGRAASISGGAPEATTSIVASSSTAAMISGTAPQATSSIDATTGRNVTIAGAAAEATCVIFVTAGRTLAISAAAPEATAAIVAVLGAETSLIRRAIAAGYAAGIGFVDIPGAGDMPNPFALAAALREGWTLAEAVSVFTPRRNNGLRVIGDPLARVLLPKQGYNVYSRSTPGSADTLVAVAPSGDSSIDVDGFAANSEQWIHVRAVDRLGTEDDEPLRLRRVAFDAAGAFQGTPPNRPIDVALSQAGGVVTAKWSYRHAGQAVAPDVFRVYRALGDAAFDLGTIFGTVNYQSASSFSLSLGTHAHGTRVRILVSAVAAGGVGEAFSTARPSLVVDTSPPETPGTIDVEVTPE